MGICGGATADSGDCAISKRNMTYKSVKSGKVSHIAIPVLKDSVYIMGGGGDFLGRELIRYSGEYSKLR